MQFYTILGISSMDLRFEFDPVSNIYLISFLLVRMEEQMTSIKHNERTGSLGLILVICLEKVGT